VVQRQRTSDEVVKSRISYADNSPGDVNVDGQGIVKPSVYVFVN